jgi:phenylacetate-CoA ligase
MLPADRFPHLTDSSHRTLLWLEEHPHAPRYTHRGLHRLTQPGLKNATVFESLIDSDPPRWKPNTPPDWVRHYVAERCADTPFYRRWGAPPESFHDLPTTSRADLNREPWSFVPDQQSLDDLVVYNTSGTTGHPLSILTHADTLALYIPLLKAALRRHDITQKFEPSRVAIAYISYQKETYTYAAVSPLLNDAGFVKINLHPNEWRDPNDVAQFLNDCNPLVYTGTPLALTELAKLKLARQPTALLSTSMTLTAGLRDSLHLHFACPIIDIYSMNETGPIAVNNPTTRLSNHPTLLRLLQPRLYVEILDPDDQPCPPGGRGEITVTGGINPLLPLIRYRTGDHAALEFDNDRPCLIDLEGRAPITFRATDGTLLNNIDVSLALRPFAIAQYQLHQFADRSLRLKRRDAHVDDATLQTTLLNLFGASQPLTIEDLSPHEKVIQYTSDLTT